MIREYHSSNQTNAQVKMVVAKHFHHSKIGSTNSWARDHFDQWAATGLTLVTADEQTAGRGRFKRRWESPPHVNIYATFCLWLELARTDFILIPQILAFSAAQALEEQGFTPKTKWPNDLLLNGKKMAGILCEAIVEQEKRGMMCGIGLNVNMPQEVIDRIDRPATSLLLEAKKSLDVSLILERLIHNFTEDLTIFLAQGFAPFFPLLQKRSVHKKGQPVCFHDNQTLLEAKFFGLNPDGSVELEMSNGQLKIFYAGEFIS